MKGPSRTGKALLPRVYASRYSLDQIALMIAKQEEYIIQYKAIA
jgi:hypothetical protein